MDFDDPPSLRAVVRGMLGVAMAIAAVALVALFAGSGHVEWTLVALIFALWAARSFLDTILGSVVEPFGRFLGSALAGGALPSDTPITIDEETAIFERELAAVPPPAAHRAILMGIRLAEIYRTHEHDNAKADALIARLATQYPDAPELKYVRPS